MLGTPAYMAPEQHAGARTIDARADQFAFCVALYEGLYGERPFAGESELALYEQIAAGNVREVPRGRGPRVPAWLRAVVLRGLAFEPSGRHASMQALLDQLRRPRAVRRRRVWAAAIALTVAGGAIAGGSASGLFASADDPCAGAGARLAGVWDEAGRRALHGAFAASGARDAVQQWNAFAAGLDRYSAAWTAMQTDSCEATHVRGEQSQELLDLRGACLDRRLGELGALVDLYRRADPAMVSSATAAAGHLSSLEACANAAALGEERPPRDAPAGRALRAEIGRARASYLAGRARDSLASAQAAARRARGAGDRAAEAAALVTVAASRRVMGELKAAEEAAYEALSAAEAAALGRERGGRLARAHPRAQRQRQPARGGAPHGAPGPGRARAGRRDPAARGSHRGVARRPGHGPRRARRGAAAPGARAGPARAARSRRPGLGPDVVDRSPGLARGPARPPRARARAAPPRAPRPPRLSWRRTTRASSRCGSPRPPACAT